MPQVQPCC